MSLLQGVLRSTANMSLEDESDDEWVGVQSAPGTPHVLSRPSSRPSSRAASPTRGPRINLLSRKPPSDPLRAFPTDISQRIFTNLRVRDLATCSRVSRKWNKSQTMNYVWFQHYRKENFQDASLPPGKWTKRESKQNWRTTYLKSSSTRSPPSTPMGYYTPSSGARSGYQTPRERNEEKWTTEQEEAARPNKVEMREMYKELGGRKSKGKSKFGAGTRDRGGLGGGDEGW